MPTPYTMKFIIMVWFEFFARASPVSTIAKPACMNMTRNPVTSVQTKLVATRFWPTIVTTSATVKPALASAIGMSAAVPVIVPAGSPLAFSSAEGLDTPLMSASVSILGSAAGTGAAAGAGVWANAARGDRHHASAQAANSLFLVVIAQIPL